VKAAAPRRLALSALAISAALHLLLIWAWQRHSLSGVSGTRHAPIEIELLPIGPKTEPVVGKGVRPQPRRPAGNPLPKHVDTRPDIFPPAGQERDGEQSAPAAGASVVDAMIDAAKRNAGNIDRELRQAFPSRQPVPVPLETPLAKGIARAGLPGGTVIQETVLADGRRITKVITPSSTYCVLGRRAGAGITENELAALTTTTCPN